MKENSLASKIMVGVICLGVLLYLGVYFLLSWREDLVTTTAYSYTQSIGAEATALLVREETVLRDSGGYVDLVLSEGARAAKGDAVALLYTTSAALETRQSIRTLEAEIEQLNYTLSSGGHGGGSSMLDSAVTDSIISLRAMAASGDLTALEDSALNLRTLVFRRDYAYDDPQASVRLNQLIAEKRQQLSDLTRSLNAVSRTVLAPDSGVFSGQVDGYEGLISPADLDSLTVGGLEQLLSRQVSPETGCVGKLITGSRWYLAALLTPEAADGLALGRRYTVSFSRDYYGDVDMTLERVDMGEEKALAIFSSNTQLAGTTLLRVQSVDIVTKQIEGIRVPRGALRVTTETLYDTNEENGIVTTTQVNHYGVYTLVGTQSEWQEVKVLYTGDSYYLVEPAEPDAASRLRAGDTVFLSTAGLYDGKVVR